MFDDLIIAGQQKRALNKVGDGEDWYKADPLVGVTLDYGASGCSEVGIYGKSINEVIAIAKAPAPGLLSDAAPSLGTGLIVTGLCALAVFIAFWGLGWLCAGFTRD